MMCKQTELRFGVLATALIMAASVPVMAAPMATPAAVMKSRPTAQMTLVRRRGSIDGAGLAAGIATGLMIGGLLAAPRYYDDPYWHYSGYYRPRFGGEVVFYGTPSWEAYCLSRYHSFDPVSGTYLGRDGRRHYCR
jgi:heme A synthase